MSRYGSIPVPIPKGVEVTLAGRVLKAKGPKGELTLELPKDVQLMHEQQEVVVALADGTKLTPAHHGLYRSLINNMVIGVSKGFEKRLQMIGVGYRAAVQGNDLDLQVGYSHPTKMPIPKGIQVAIDKGTSIVVSGIDKQHVGQFAAEVRAMRPPEPYKGKGIRYEEEYVRKKAGKAAKAK